MDKGTNISAIVAVRGGDLAIGNNLDMIYSFAKDLKNFQKETMGGIVVMGRKTWDSLPHGFKPLKGRINVVMTRDKTLNLQGVRVVYSVEEVLNMGDKTQEEIWIIGGSEIYKLFEPYIDKYVLTVVNGDHDREANVFFSDQEITKHFKIDGEPQSFSNEENRMTGNLCSFKIQTYVRK